MRGTPNGFAATRNLRGTRRVKRRGSRVDEVLFVPLEALLFVFASWTLAYHVCLLLALPARLLVLPFALCFGPLVAVSWRRWLGVFRRFGAFRGGRGLLVALGGVSLLGAAFALVVSRPDPDDLAFFHRALVQLGHPELPFVLHDTTHNQPGLAAISLTHTLTSYEHLVAMAASWLGLDPLWVYHNAAAALVMGLFPVVYFLLYRGFRLSPWTSLAATVLALGFLLVDGGPHRSFGNFGPVRCWQGKVVLVMELLPLVVLMVLRCLRRPSRRNLLLAAAAAVCAPGLSGSGIFLVPILVFAVSVAYVVGYGPGRTRVRRALLVNLAAGYCTLLALGFAVGVLPGPTDTTVWNGWGSPTWWRNLALVVEGPWVLARDLLILLALPLLALPRPWGRVPVLLTLALCAVFANPLAGPFWIERLYTTGYWRLAYLFPLPLCAGLVGGVVLASLRAGGRRGVKVLAVGVLGWVAVVAFEATVLERAFWKKPWEYKFLVPSLEASRAAAPLLDSRSVLAPPEIVRVLGLLNPSIRFEATREGETLHLFGNAGLAREGRRRVLAQRCVSESRASQPARQAFLASVRQSSLRRGVDAIVVRSPALATVEALLELPTPSWEVETLPSTDAAPPMQRYVLLLRRSEGSEGGPS